MNGKVMRAAWWGVRNTNLYKKVEHTEEGNDDCHQRCGDQDDNTRTYHIEHGAHEHFQNNGDPGVNGVHLLGKAVDKVTAGGSLKERYRRAQDVVKHGLMKVARRQNAPDGHGQGVTKDCHPYNTTVRLTWLQKEKKTSIFDHL